MKTTPILYSRPIWKKHNGFCSTCNSPAHTEKCVFKQHPRDNGGDLTPWSIRCARCAVKLAIDCYPGLEVFRIVYGPEAPRFERIFLTDVAS